MGGVTVKSRYKVNPDKNYYDENKPSYFDQLPDDLLQEIFFRVRGNELCKSLSLVSKKWLSLIADDSFWIQKCIRDHKLNRDMIRLLNEKCISWSPKEIYFNNLFNRNLLKNPCGDNSFNHWCFLRFDESRSTPQQIVHLYKRTKQVDRPPTNWNNEWSDSAYNWAVENLQTYSFEKLLDNNGAMLRCFATSYSLAEKMQVVDLSEEGKFAEIYASLRDPIIEVSERYTCRGDTGPGAQYNVIVWLISDDFEIVDRVSYSDRIDDLPCPWKTFSHRFSLKSDTSKPVRYIMFYHSGSVSSN